MKKLVVSICVVLPIIGFIFIAPLYYLMHPPERAEYENDKKDLFQIAERLGYHQNNQVNFFRNKGTTSSNHDYTSFVFTSTDSLETFSQKVSQLGLPINRYYTDREEIDTQFLGDVNRGYPYKITLSNINNTASERLIPKEFAPSVTLWNFYLDSSKKRKELTVYYAMLTRGNIHWQDKTTGKELGKNLVVLRLSR